MTALGAVVPHRGLDLRRRRGARRPRPAAGLGRPLRHRRCADRRSPIAIAAAHWAASSSSRTAATPRSARIRAATSSAAPVFTVGVGTPAITRDREVVAMTAGEPRLADSTVDVHVSALSTGYGTQPLDLTLTANGRPVDVRRVAAADGAPVHTVFTVSPDPTRADGLPGVGAGRARRDRRREQHPQRAGRAARPAAPAAAGRGRARLRAHLPQAGAGPRHQPRRRLGGAQGRDRRRPADLLRAGRGVARRDAGRRIPRTPRRALPLRRGRVRQRRSRRSSAARSSRTPRRSSPPAAAGCWCSAAARSSSRGWPARRSTRCCRWTCRIAGRSVARVSNGAARRRRAGRPHRRRRRSSGHPQRRDSRGRPAAVAGACRRWPRCRSSAGPRPGCAGPGGGQRRRR